MGESNDIFESFIKLGGLANKRERKKIVEIIKDWEYVPPHISNIDNKYLNEINRVIEDEIIKKILKSQPSLKLEIHSRLLKLLENIEYEISENCSNNYEFNEFEQFKTISDKKFVAFIDGKNLELTNLIRKNFSRKDLSLIELKNIYKKEINSVKKKKKILDAQISQLKETNVELNNEIKYTELEIDEIRHNSLKIVGKIDLKTNKPVKYDSPYEKSLAKKKASIEKINDSIIKNQEQVHKLSNIRSRLEPNIERIKKGFFDKWESIIKLKLIKEEIKIVENLRRTFFKKIYDKIEKILNFLKTLSPFISDTKQFKNLWNLSEGNLQNIDFDELEKSAEFLQNNKAIQELAEKLGKYRLAEIEFEEEEFDKYSITSVPKINYAGKSELIGITEGNDLNNLLPSELALFFDEETEDIFYKKFIEKKLQSYKFISRENLILNEKIKGKRKKKVEKDKGPFILAIDTSGSMRGEPEKLAKIIAFAITKIAIRDNRKAFLISFSVGTTVFELTDIQNSISELISFLKMSFNGGTDATEAVRIALKQMETKSYEKADLLIISDGDFGNLEYQTLESVKTLKEKGNKFNALMIGNQHKRPSLGFCNNVWNYDPSLEKLDDLVLKVNDVTS